MNSSTMDNACIERANLHFVRATRPRLGYMEGSMDAPLIRLAEAHGFRTTGAHEWPEKVDSDVRQFVESSDSGSLFVVEDPDGLVIGPPPRDGALRVLCIVKPRGKLPEPWENHVIVVAMPAKSVCTALQALVAKFVLPLFDCVASGSPLRHKLVEAERALENLARNAQVAYVDLEHGALAETARDALPKANSGDVSALNELQSVVNQWKLQVSALARASEDGPDVSGESTASSEIGFWTSLDEALRGVERQLESPLVRDVWQTLESHRRFHATRNFATDTGLTDAVARVQGYQSLFRDLAIGKLIASPQIDQLTAALTEVFVLLTRRLRASGFPSSRSIVLAELLGCDFSNALHRIVNKQLEEIAEANDKPGKLIELCASIEQACDEWDLCTREFTAAVRGMILKRGERFMPVKLRESHSPLLTRARALGTLAAKHAELVELWPSASLDAVFTNLIERPDLLSLSAQEWREVELDYARQATEIETRVANQLKTELDAVTDDDDVLAVFVKNRHVLARPQVRAVTHKFQNALLESTRVTLLRTERATHSLPVSTLPRIIRKLQLQLRLEDIRNRLLVVIGEDWREHVEAAHIGEVCDQLEHTLDVQGDVDAWKQSVDEVDVTGPVLAVVDHEIVVTGSTGDGNFEEVLRDLRALGIRFDAQFMARIEALIDTSVAQSRLVDCVVTLGSIRSTLLSRPRIQCVQEVAKLSQTAVEYALRGLNCITWQQEDLSVFVRSFEHAVTVLEMAVARVAETDSAIEDLMLVDEIDTSRISELAASVLSPNYASAVDRDLRILLAGQVAQRLVKWMPPSQHTRIEIREQAVCLNPPLPVLQTQWFDALNEVVKPVRMAVDEVPANLERAYIVAMQRIEAAFAEAEKVAQYWLSFSVLYQVRKSEILAQLRAQDNFDLWVETVSELQLPRPNSQILVVAHDREVAAEIAEKVESWQDFLVEHLVANVFDKSTRLLDNSREARRVLEQSRLDLHGLLNGLRAISDAIAAQTALNHWLPSIVSCNRFVNARQLLPQRWVSSDVLQTELGSLDALLARRQADLERARPNVLKEIESRTASLVGETDRLAQEWRDNKPLQSSVDPEAALNALNSMSTKVTGVSEKLESLSHAYESLQCDVPRTLTSLVGKASSWRTELEVLFLGWTEIRKGWKLLEAVVNHAFFSITGEEISKAFAAFKTYLSEETPEQALQMPAFARLNDRASTLSEALPRLLILKSSDAIQLHHLRQLVPNCPQNPKLSDIWLHIPASVSEVVETAEGEHQLLKYIDGIKEKWSALVLDGSDHAIRNLGSILPLVSDHLAAFGAMAGSPHYYAVKTVVEDWKNRLLLAKQALDLLAEVQQQDIYLRGVLTNKSVASVLPGEARRFQGVHEEFIQVFESANQKPPLEFAAAPRLVTNLTRLVNQFAALNRGLSGFLETQRRRFPRLFFVGDEKLLEIVGSPLRDWGFKHLPAIFPGVANVEESKVISPEGEVLLLDGNLLDTSDNIEMLIDLESRISQSLKRSIATAITELNENIGVCTNAEKFAKWLERTPLQAVLVALRVRRPSSHELLTFLPGLGDDSLLWARRKESVIAELVYQKKEVYFPSLVVSLREDRGEIRCFCGTNVWDYGYEYLGCPEPIIRTTVTDDLYLAAATALAQGKGVSAVGPAGTGKTETVKSLGHFMGRRVVVFNCDDQFDHEAVSRILVGCGATRCWACFDEFNRLSRFVLSSVAQAVSASLAKAPVFVTMNPGYAGRRVLPPNMRDQFREFVLAAPQSEEIARVILFSHGQSAPTASSGAVKLLANLQARLSRQSHYDWGLRALKGIIRIAVLLNGDLKSACQAAIRPRLVAEDVAAFDEELRAVFGDTPASFEKLTLLSKDSSDHVQSLEIFSQLYAATMIVGPSGCGKTGVWRELARLNGAEVVVVDPSALSKSALIGSMDAITREWSDGFLPALFRRLADNLRGEQSQKWFLVFDGEIEPEWAEALNSLLDDNRHLTLANGEILDLPPQLHIVFETTSLQAATPATVSRCGMIYMMSAISPPIPAPVLEAAGKVDHAMEFIPIQAYDSMRALNLGNQWLSMVWALAGDSSAEGRRQVSEAVRSVADCDLPPGSLTDYYVSELTGQWHSWADSVGSVVLDADAVNRPDVLIPTLDTASHECLLQASIASHRPLILVGPPGSGKTMTLYSLIRQLPQISKLISLNFSSTATPELVIQALELYCEYSMSADGKVLAPSGTRWAVLFIDELNIVKPNKCGVVAVLQFLRHFVEQGGFYNAAGEFVKVERVQLVAACNPPPLRRPLPSSLLRHFISVQVGYPSKQSLATIYSTFFGSIDPLAAELTEPTLDVYFKLPELLPNETWTPRELTRWVRSIATSWNAISESQRSPKLLNKIWGYEAQRVLCDRLTATDKVAVLEILRASSDEIWSYFVTRRPSFVSFPTLQNFFSARLRQFMEEAAGEGDRNLVVHHEFVDHVSRVDRVLRQPQGHALLVGPPAVGKTTIVRFAGWLLGISLDILLTHSNYTEADFSHDLRRVLLKALRCPACLVLGDDLFSQPDFIELMNSLLGNGEVPGLFSTQDQISELEEAARRAGFVGEDLVAWFRTQVVANLHVIFITTDISLASPALLNRCSVDRFEPWTLATRIDIAKHWCASTDAPSQVVDLLASSLGLSSQGAAFIESCRQFERSYTEMKGALEESQRHFVSGSDRLKSSVLEISHLKRQLASRQEQLTAETEKSSAVLSKMLLEQSEAERKRAAAVEIRHAVQLQTQQIDDRRAAANRDLEATEPLIKQAAAGVQNIKKSHLNELRAFHNPPDPVKMTLEAVCLVLGLETDGSWRQILAAVRGDEFISRIVYFDSSSMSPELISYIEHEYMRRPSFTYERVDRASKACGPLLRWVVAQIAYGRAIAAVQPLVDEIEVLNTQAEETRAKLAAIESMLCDLEQAIEVSKIEYSRTVAQCEALKVDMHRISEQLQRAELLMSSLVSEKTRWSAAANEFPAKVAVLPQRALIEAAYIAYGGSLDPKKRRDIAKTVLSHGTENGGAVNGTVDGNTDSLSAESLSDDLSTDLIISKSWSTVLIVDPSNTWRPEDGNVKVTSFLLDSDTLGKELDTALRFGQHLVVQNAEQFNPLLQPVLTRDFVRRGARLLVQLGHGDVDVSPNFRLTLHTRDLAGVQQSRPLLLPRVNIVDFSVTETKFEHIVATELLRAKTPELASRREALREVQKKTSAKLNQLETQLLTALSGPTSDKILENQLLVESLEKLKAEAAHLTETQTSTVHTLAEIEVQSRQFQDSAHLAAEIYRRVTELRSVNKFYNVGVDWLLAVVQQCATNFDKFEFEVTRRVLAVLNHRDWKLFGEGAEPLELLDVIRESPRKLVLAGLATTNATDPGAGLSMSVDTFTTSVVPMGSIQACQRADRVLAQAMESGEWVVIQNIEVANDDWLRQLLRKMQLSEPHEDFRLILTGQQSEIVEFPELVTSARPVAVERERGVKQNLLSALTSQSNAMDFALCYIHASFSEMFAIPFSVLDLHAARWFAKQLEGSALNHALLTCVWGARTGDLQEKNAMKKFIDRSLSHDAFPADFRAWAESLPSDIDWVPAN